MRKLRVLFWQAFWGLLFLIILGLILHYTTGLH